MEDETSFEEFYASVESESNLDQKIARCASARRLTIWRLPLQTNGRDYTTGKLFKLERRTGGDFGTTPRGLGRRREERAVVSKL